MENRSLPTAQPVAKLIEELNKLPGIGTKSAQRLAYFILRSSTEYAKALADAINAVKNNIVLCSICQNITEKDPCLICEDETRDKARICIIEEPLDILPVERSRCYKGTYHVLHGVISPMDGIGPDNLKLKELLARLNNSSIQEIIIATNPTLEGEATALYIQHLITPLGIKLTRLACGLPSGGDLEYADDITLIRAFEGRQLM